MAYPGEDYDNEVRGGGPGAAGGTRGVVSGLVAVNSLPHSLHRPPTTPTPTPTTMICTRVSAGLGRAAVVAPRVRRACWHPAGSVGPGRAVRQPPHCSFFPSGDPKQDLAYERQYEQQTYQVIPEVIKNFIQYFHKTVSDLIDQKVYELQASRVSSDVIDQKVYEIQDIYENRYKAVLPTRGNHCLNCDESAPCSLKEGLTTTCVVPNLGFL